MEIPVVRFFLACRQIEVDASRRDFSLQRLIYKIVRLPGEPFPCLCEPMALFALLSNGRGTHSFGIELTWFSEGEEETIWQSASRPVDLGLDPTAVLGLPIPLKNVTFAQAGQFSFHLLCNESRIAVVEVDVK
jgi:hypothetical protein